jgi:hypothetical protein
MWAHRRTTSPHSNEVRTEIYGELCRVTSREVPNLPHQQPHEGEGNDAMKHEMEKPWSQPTFENLERGIWHGRKDNCRWLHWEFAAILCVMSETLPTKASAELLKLEAARKVVSFYHNEAEAYWQSKGFVTKWSPDCLEGIALEIAKKLPRHPAVVNVVMQMMERRRDVVFADRLLTRGDELFFVRQWNVSDYPEECHEQMDEIGIEVIKEDFIETIDRSLDSYNELKAIKASRQFIKLFRILTSLKRVHDVVKSA